MGRKWNLVVRMRARVVMRKANWSSTVNEGHDVVAVVAQARRLDQVRNKLCDIGCECYEPVTLMLGTRRNAQASWADVKEHGGLPVETSETGVRG